MQGFEPIIFITDFLSPPLPPPIASPLPQTQAFWVFTVSLPVVFVNAPTTPANIDFGTPQDIVGTVVFWIGLTLETFADMQKFFWKDKPENQGKWCTFGEWSILCTVILCTSKLYL